MEHLLLKTKLFIPPLHAQVITRPRLQERLQALTQYKLTLISAPAGFGKTTLLSSWYATLHPQQEQAHPPPICVAWLSLDERDNDPTSFWRYLIAALETVQPGVGNDALALLASTQPPPIQTILTLLINALSTFPSAMVLVLDDYHLIETQAIHDGITFLLDHVPKHMHLVITSRADPPLPLARLRAHRHLLELRMSDLRFTREEINTFLHEMGTLSQAEAVTTALETYTEGWIVGMHLATLALRGHEDNANFVATFLGKHPHIIDYLTAEVLQQQSHPLQTFLLHTCILDQLSASLCDALLQHSNSYNILRTLEQKNLFIVPLDTSHEWYRYHHLFAEALRTHLRQMYPERIPELQRRASAWYEQQGLMHEAIRFALAASDFVHAATLLETLAQNNPTLWRRSELVSIHTWLEDLPASLVDTRPLLSLLYTYTSLYTSLEKKSGDALQIVAHRLQHIEKMLLTNTDYLTLPLINGIFLTLNSLISFAKGDAASALIQANQALELLPADNVAPRVLATQTLANASRLLGHTAATHRALSELLLISQVTNDVFSTLQALYNIAELYTLQGDLFKAAQTFQQAIALVEQTLKSFIPSGCYIGLSAILVEWNELDTASHYLHQGIAQTKINGDPGVLLYGYETLIRLFITKNELDNAFSILTNIESILQKYPFLLQNPHFNVVSTHFAHLSLLHGDLATANDWAAQQSPHLSAHLTQQDLFTFSILARIYLATDRVIQAVALIARLVEVAEEMKQRALLIPVLILQALGYAVAGDLAQAHTVIERVLCLAEPGGYMLVFLNEGPTMRQLLETLLTSQRDKHPSALPFSIDYLQRILAAFPAPPPTLPDQASQRHGRSTSGPLSLREIEVLRLIAVGHSDREIAEQLTLAETTVKTHARRIYARLQVKNRTQAVTRARELDLL